MQQSSLQNGANLCSEVIKVFCHTQPMVKKEMDIKLSDQSNCEGHSDYIREIGTCAYRKLCLCIVHLFTKQTGSLLSFVWEYFYISCPLMHYELRRLTVKTAHYGYL